MTDHLSAFWDISPTMRELAGAEVQADTDGISMVPTLLGQEGQKKHDSLYWEFSEQGGKRAFRKGKWKLIHLNAGKSLTPSVELYNLENDLGEEKNLASSNPEMVSELTKLMNLEHTTAEISGFKFAFELTEQELMERKKPKKNKQTKGKK